MDTSQEMQGQRYCERGRKVSLCTVMDCVLVSTEVKRSHGKPQPGTSADLMDRGRNVADVEMKCILGYELE